MRFPLQCGLTLLVCYAAGYALHRPALTSQAPVAAGSAADEAAPGASPSRRVAPPPQIAPDLFSALEKDTDYVAQGDRVSRAIEAMDAAALAALFRPPECERLLARLEDLPQEIRHDVISSALARWLALDKAAVRRWLPHAPEAVFKFGYSLTEYRWVSAMELLAARMPEEALAFARDHPALKGTAESGMLRLVLREIAAVDPARASAFVDGFDDPQDRLAAKWGYLSGLSRADFRAAADLWKTTTDTGERAALFEGIEAAVGRQPPSLVEDLCWHLDGSWAEVLDAFSDANPAAAAEMLARLVWHPAAPKKATQLFGGIAHQLVTHVGEPAIEWALALPESVPGSVFHNLGSHFAERDPAGAVRLLAAKIPEGPRRDAAFKGIFNGWLHRDANAAFAWIDTLPANAERDSIIVGGLNALTDSIHHPETLARMEARLDTLTDPAFTGAVGKSLQTLAQRAPKTIAPWAAKNAGTRATEAPLRTAVRAWTADDPQSASAWVATLPPGRARDAAAEGSANAWMATNAESAAAWVEQIANPQRRLALAPKVVESWTRHDPAAAQAWAQRMGVSISPR